MLFFLIIILPKAQTCIDRVNYKAVGESHAFQSCFTGLFWCKHWKLEAKLFIQYV